MTLRHELKYMLDDKSLATFKAISQSRFGFSQRYEPRNVTSIYFDTVNFDFARSNLSGESNRVKVRLRWYNSPSKKGIKTRFELKLRRNKVGEKMAFEGPPIAYGDTLERVHNLVIEALGENVYQSANLDLSVCTQLCW